MIKSTLKLMLAIVLFASCSQTEKAPSGMVYKITHGKGNEKLIQNGQFVKVHLEYKFKTKNSILQTTFDKMPIYIPFESDRMKNMKYSFTEILHKLRKGDKVEFTLSIDSLVKKNMLQSYDDKFVKGDFIIGKLEVLDVFANSNLKDADQSKEIVKLNETRKKQLKDFLAKNKINAKETPEGVFLVIKNIGDTTNKIDTTKQVSVNYKLYNLKGEVIQSTFDKSDPNSKPMEFRVGEVGFIEGWNIGLSYFGKGGTGTIYIPSAKAFADPNDQPDLQFENLIFDIEIVDVKKKEALPAENKAIMDQINEQIKNEADAKAKNSTKTEKKPAEKSAPKATENKQ